MQRIPVSLPPFLPPRGWYADPQDPRLARWWDGAEWTRFTHRVARGTLFGPGYTHGYWIGANRNAGRSRVATFLIFGAIVYSMVSSLFPMAGSAPILLAGFSVAAAVCVLNIVFASRALLASAILGARGLAISNLAIGSFETLVCLGAVAIFAVTLVLHPS